MAKEKKIGGPRAYKVRRLQKPILNERPEGMDFEEYRKQRRIMSKWLKNRVRGGFLVWKLSEGTLVGKVPGLIFVK